LNINNFLKRSIIATASLVITNTVAAKTDQELITVMNPVVESKLAERLPLAPRLDTLEGKTLYMVDINWGGPDAGYGVFKQIEVWLAQKMPSVKVEIRRLRGSYMMDDPALYREVADKGDAALIGISG
jgi:hypothetical protein